MTESNTGLFSFSGRFCFILFWNSMCKDVCIYVCVSVCLCVCVCVWLLIADNSQSCYIWIENDITDFNTCFFSVSLFFFFSVLCSISEWYV